MLACNKLLHAKHPKMWLRFGAVVLFIGTFFMFMERDDLSSSQINPNNFAAEHHNYRRLTSNNVPSIIFTNVADVRQPPGLTDTAFFWSIPKSGGPIATEYAFCLGLTVANQARKMNGHEHDTALEIFEPWVNRKVVNVDTSTLAGLQSAKSRGFVQSLLADIVFSNDLYEVADIFNENYKLRVTTLFRHPVDRAVRLFNHKEDEYAAKNWTIKEYVQSNGYPKNWMIYKLLYDGKYSTGDEATDLELAKTIIRNYFLIGLTDRIEESLERFDKYLNFDHGSRTAKECSDAMLSKGIDGDKDDYPTLERGSEEWRVVVDANIWDIRLYEFAAYWFDKQAVMFQ